MSLDRGVWGVLPTPFTRGGADVDLVSLERIVTLYRSLGATGVVALGVFGEGSQLRQSEKKRVLETVCTSADGLGVVAGITQADTDSACSEAEDLNEFATQLSGVMVQVNSCEVRSLRAHLDRVHSSADCSIIVQDYPVVTGVTIEPEELAKAIDNAPYVAAVKCESPPTSLFIARAASLVEVPLFGGLGGIGLLDELAAGAAGAMTGFSHPEALLATVKAFEEEGMSAARARILPWLPLINFEAQSKIGLSIRKESFRRRGLLRDADVRAPALAFPGELEAHLDFHLREATALIG